MSRGNANDGANMPIAAVDGHEGRTANLDERQRRRYDGSKTRIPADLLRTFEG